MNKLTFGAAVAALALALPGIATAQRTPAAVIIVVDSDRIYRECTACVAAQAQLQAQATNMQTRRQTLGAPLQQEMQSIEQAAQAARNQTGAARTAAEQAIQTRLQALQTRQTAANNELTQLEQTFRSTSAHVSQQIDQRLLPIIQQSMNAHNANLALPRGATYHYAPSLDVTNEVMAALNQQLPSVSVTPLPQQQTPQQPQQPQPPRPQGR